jgi:cytochrome b561
LRGTQVERYGAVAQAFHWLIAALIFVMLGLGYYMEDLPEGSRKLELFGIDKSIGITTRCWPRSAWCGACSTHRRRCPPA